MNEDYSKRELDEHFKAMDSRFDKQDVQLTEIKVQTTKTNGSVISLKAWRTGLTMCLAIIAFIVIPLIVYSFQLSQENLKNSILLELKTIK